MVDLPLLFVAEKSPLESLCTFGWTFELLGYYNYTDPLPYHL